ncbi:serpin B [Tamaricihabitans halophyticus]|uniref:Serpin B n=1 Tax=Tamaricihabitans halophyticus TaxID=1262583 RepID=A0A4R2R5R3_9PSEU|nr:serpin family protein [Tamaricihabitans halophyticus]TCP54921.1 serpin B [Tamaricihabitans halophyticus]
MSTARLSFALDLHRELSADPGHNSCYSPYSVASALGMVSQAASGDTRAELLDLLLGDREGEFGKRAELLASAAILDPPRAGAPEVPTLAVANGLWAAEDLPINPDFLVDLAGWPGAKLATAPFRADPEAARGRINADVAETTRQLIPELIPAGQLGPATVAALVNAVYLRVAWRARFAARQTEPDTFHAPDRDYPVSMMRQTEQLGYAAGDGWQVVRLPAEGGVEAVVLLPDGELGAAEAALDGPRLGALLDAPRQTRVRLSLPRFEVRAAAELSSALGTLGVRRLFGSGAELTGLSSDTRLAVSAALHEAVLRVDEEGLEGAAATAVLVRMVAMPRDEPVEVTVDRPFLFLVRHAATGEIYFFARIAHP